MRLNLPKLLFLLVLIFVGFWLIKPALADDTQNQIDQITKQISDLESAIAPLKTESSDLQKKISSAKSQITKIEGHISALNQNLADKETELNNQQQLLAARVRRYYKNSKKFNPILMFLSSQEGSSLLQQYTWYQSIISKDKETITQYTTDISTLNENKTKLETQQTSLASLKKNLETRFGFLANEIKKAETYKAELSAKQQSLIAAKTAMFNTSVGDVSSSDDPASRADYNPGFSPAFALFSFGAPHRKGMSQYGAYGRAKAGQNYETILKAYYGDIKIEKTDSPGSITIRYVSNGRQVNEPIPFEDNYLVGIAEMPASWGDNGGYEALKAQAIAARTYALNSTNNSSADHTTPQLWDTPCGNQSCWPNDAYEKISGSPWYYKGWYKTRSNNSYGRSHPWLNQEEFADIVNAVLYFDKTGDSSHLSQIQNCISSCDGNAWSKDELRRQVADKGGPISSINSVSVDYSTSGDTRTVHISTDKGQLNFSAANFKTVFNLRAPGALVIKSGLFNLEKK